MDSGPKALPGSFSFCAARLLLPRGEQRPHATVMNLAGTNPRAGSLSAEDKQRNALLTGTATPGRARRDIMACTVRDESCPDQYRLFTHTQR